MGIPTALELNEPLTLLSVQGKNRLVLSKLKYIQGETEPT